MLTLRISTKIAEWSEKETGITRQNENNSESRLSWPPRYTWSKHIAVCNSVLVGSLTRDSNSLKLKWFRYSVLELGLNKWILTSPASIAGPKLRFKLDSNSFINSNIDFPYIKLVDENKCEYLWKFTF